MPIIPSLKKITKHKIIEEIPDPEFFLIPLESYRNELLPLLEQGDSVQKYQKLAKADSFFSSSVHAPASGKYLGLKEIEGKKYMLLQNDFQNLETDKISFDVNTISAEQLYHLLEEFGIEGGGGARFPTHLKYKTEHQIHTLIINGAECEPYLSSDYILMKHKTDELMQVLSVLKKILNLKAICFGIEKENKELKRVLENSAQKHGFSVDVTLLKNEYPQGGELQLIKATTKSELSKGEIPAKHGIIVHNVATLYSMFQALFQGIPFTERTVTISGNSQMKPGNYSVKIGTSVDYILDKTGNSVDEDSHSVILGGAMMGKQVHSLETPVHKGSGGILILKNPKTEDFNCIGCGYCVDVCPQKLMPLEFVRNYLQNETEKLKEFNLNDCIECGACAYICPSEVPLMRSIYEGKKRIRTKNMQTP